MVDFRNTTTATSGLIWQSWCDNTITTASNNQVWSAWTSGTGAYTSTTSDVIWGIWVSLPITTDEHYRVTVEQKADQARREAEAIKAEEERRKAADERALQLLLDNMEENQKEIFEKTGAIPVTGQSGVKYLIRKGRTRNVEELDKNGRYLRRLCFHPSDWQIPDYDSMLTQKLMLEMAEDQVRRVANYS